jgi:hypothetical protein
VLIVRTGKLLKYGKDLKFVTCLLFIACTNCLTIVQNVDGKDFLSLDLAMYIFFVRSSKFFNFYLELHVYRNKFKNLIWTNKFKFSF